MELVGAWPFDVCLVCRSSWGTLRNATLALGVVLKPGLEGRQSLGAERSIDSGGMLPLLRDIGDEAACSIEGLHDLAIHFLWDGNADAGVVFAHGVSKKLV